MGICEGHGDLSGRWGFVRDMGFVREMGICEEDGDL